MNLKPGLLERCWNAENGVDGLSSDISFLGIQNWWNVVSDCGNVGKPSKRQRFSNAAPENKNGK